MDERSRALIHDLMVAILEGRATTDSEPVPRTINVDKWNRAIRIAIARHARVKESK
jgi:hypothetical protein